MSICLVHSGMFEENRYRVILDWFHFIHRCFAPSRWSRQNQAVIPALDLHTSFNSAQLSSAQLGSVQLRTMIIVCSIHTLLLTQTPSPHSLLIDIRSNHRLTSFIIIITQSGLASMFQSFGWSMLKSDFEGIVESLYFEQYCLYNTLLNEIE